jgi:hypothetical protein
MSVTDELLKRAKSFTLQHNLTLGDALGSGVHGSVFTTESLPEKNDPGVRSAIKVLQRETDYCKERDVYLRLKEHDVTTVYGCRVPQLLRFDDRLWVVEMTIVKRPFVLDFAGAYLDWRPDFSEEVMAEWHAEKQEQFGKRWTDAQAVLWGLEKFGVFMVDVNPGNISFGD